jgi:hypothetical protein
MFSSATAWPPALKSPAGEGSQGCSRTSTRGMILSQKNVDIHTPTVHNRWTYPDNSTRTRGDVPGADPPR